MPKDQVKESNVRPNKVERGCQLIRTWNKHDQGRVHMIMGFVVPRIYHKFIINPRIKKKIKPI